MKKRVGLAKKAKKKAKASRVSAICVPGRRSAIAGDHHDRFIRRLLQILLFSPGGLWKAKQNGTKRERKSQKKAGGDGNTEN